MKKKIDKRILNLLPQALQIEISENLQREDFIETDKARLQLVLREIISKNMNQGRRTDLKEATSTKKMEKVSRSTDEEIAKLIGGNKNSVHMRDYVFRMSTIDKTYADILAKLDAKKISLKKAYDSIRRKDERKQFLANISPLLESERLKLFNGEFQRLQDKLPNNSLDMIFTDPPYGGDSLALYRDLGAFAKQKLKESGILIVYAGHYHLPTIINHLGNYLNYYWIFAVEQHGASARIHDRAIYCNYKPLLCYVKGKKPLCVDSVKDLVRESAKPAKILHQWEQSTDEALYYIEHLTTKNAKVCDPMMGTGTTGVAALNLARGFIGFEKNPDTFHIAKAKLSRSMLEKDKKKAPL